MVETMKAPLVLKAGTKGYIREYCTVPSAGKWGTQPYYFQADGGITQPSPSDLSDTGTIATSTNAHLPFGPVLMPATPMTPVAAYSSPVGAKGSPLISLALLTDSQGMGTGNIGNLLHNGLFCQALTDVWAYTHLGQGGFSFNAMSPLNSTGLSNALQRRYARTLACGGITDVLTNMGTNDAGRGQALSSSQLIVRVIDAAAEARAYNARLRISTIPPRTDAANSGGKYTDTLGDLDLDSTLDCIDEFNAWVRTDPLDLDYFDLHAVFADPSNPRRWASYDGPDGLHLGPNNHIAAAAHIASKLPAMVRRR